VILLGRVQGKYEFMLRRFLGFLRSLLKNGKSIFGLILISAFLVVAFGASLFTPYTPIGEDPLDRLAPAASNVPPAWLRSLPTWLGGNPALSENMIIVQNPGSPRMIADGGEFKNETANPNLSVVPSDISYPYPLPLGYKRYGGEGSLSVTYTRKDGTTGGEVKAVIFKEFDFPYNGPPSSFYATISIQVNGSTTVSGVPPVDKLKVPVKVNVFLGSIDGRKWPIWPPVENTFYDVRIPRGFTKDKLTGAPGPIERPLYGATVFDSATGTFIDSGWITSVKNELSTISSTSQQLVNPKSVFQFPNDPASVVFSSARGSYAYGVEIVFVDTGSTEDVSTTVIIDDFGLMLKGTSFGLLGASHRGWDLFAQLLYGTRISLYLGISVAVFSVAIGLVVGLAAGYFGRIVDEVLMRTTDVLLVLPGLPLLIVLIAILGASIDNLIILLGLLGWMGFARMVRSQVLSIRERSYVEAAKAIGAGQFHIVIHHILPSVMSLVYISLATSVPGAVTAEAALSWLGFYDPTRMSWGRMLNEAVVEAGAITSWWWILPPGICISLLAASFILVGYALDEVLNPKLRLRK
jgi:ABC-type dipeptide/oligopeptide/nickel transport system permease subunit